MARYFFKLHDRYGPAPDVEGCDLHDIAAARRHAIAGARALMAEDIRDGSLYLSDYIEVSDHSGQVLLTIRFSAAVTIHP